MNMNLEFDFKDVDVTEFGVGREDQNSQRFVAVPVDAGVQKALCEIAQTTWDAIKVRDDEPAKYEPSEKYAATEYLYLPLNDAMAEVVRDLHQAASLEIDTFALTEPGEIFCYFARFTDKKKRRLTAMRRATQFKGVLKSKNRLVRMLDDTLKIIEDTVFRLDNDFDLLVDSAMVHIWRPNGFEFVSQLQEAILAAVPENIKTLEKDLPFVEFGGITEYAAKHPRAARYLASIRGQVETKGINRAALQELCKRTGVNASEMNGKIVVSPGHEIGFLEVLDRRRYHLELVDGNSECFKAASRTKLNG